MIVPLLRCALLAVAWGGARAPVTLPVPIIRQAPERCGPAAVAMVLRYYGADSARASTAESAYDPALRGSLITDLAACGRRAGFAARVTRLTEDSLHTLLEAGIPPIVLFRRGIGPATRGHYAVVVGWDGRRYVLHDGGHRPRSVAPGALMRQWDAADRQALILERPGR